MSFDRALGPLACAALVAFVPFRASLAEGWTKHVVYTGVHTNTAIAADFTGDGKVDIIASSGGKTRLFQAPDWQQTILDEEKNRNCIHSEIMDVDGDGDMDWIGGQYSPGHVYWLENPGQAGGKWTYHLIDDQINGVHGLLCGDVDGDGKPDLIANSGQPAGEFPNSIVWLKAPQRPREAARWERTVFASGDAPGLSHYMGLGDVNGDGKPDIAAAAKGGPMAMGDGRSWFAWWEAPANPQQPGWKKRLISDGEEGATNIHPADLNGDGKVDFLASRGHGRGVLWFEAPEWKPHVIHETLFGPHCLAVIDLDGDGDVDAATCAKDDKLVCWFENDGRGNFQTHVVATDQAAYDIRAVDLDGDGDLDLLIAGQTSQNVVWYENPQRGRAATKVD